MGHSLIFNQFTLAVCTGGEVKLKIFLTCTIFRLNQIHFSKYAVNGKVVCPAFSQSLMRASEIYLLVKLAWIGRNSPVSFIVLEHYTCGIKKQRVTLLPIPPIKIIFIDGCTIKPTVQNQDFFGEA